MPLLDALLDAPTPILRCTCIWHLGWRQCSVDSTRSALGFGLGGLKRPGPFCWHRQVQCRPLKAPGHTSIFDAFFFRQGILEETPEPKGIGLFGHRIKRQGEVHRAVSVEMETRLSGQLRRVNVGPWKWKKFSWHKTKSGVCYRYAHAGISKGSRSVRPAQGLKESGDPGIVQWENLADGNFSHGNKPQVTIECFLSVLDLPAGLINRRQQLGACWPWKDYGAVPDSNRYDGQWTTAVMCVSIDSSTSEHLSSKPEAQSSISR